MNIGTRPWFGAATGLLLAATWTGAAAASSYEEEIEGDEHPHIVRLVRDLYVVPKDAGLDTRIAEVDLAFVEQMGRHHKGAVDMAEVYLADPRGRNPVLRQLAQGIIANQEFEIGVLQDVRDKVGAGPRRVAGFGDSTVVVLDRGTDGLEHAWRFRKAPPPSTADIWLTPEFTVSDFDVQFVRPMMDHHKAALRMARDYNTDPFASNLILRRMNNDIVVDQRYEIGFIDEVLSRYPGDPEEVPDAPRMMEIMHESMGDMMHGSGSRMEMPPH
ncbi:MAG: DUF305 domain-containing protein [Kiloniellaceae bacterium]|nr:DUF305 domain-containing protein [Kiloniellaceae bacterium]